MQGYHMSMCYLNPNSIRRVHSGLRLYLRYKIKLFFLFSNFLHNTLPDGYIIGISSSSLGVSNGESVSGTLLQLQPGNFQFGIFVATLVMG